MQRRTPQSPLVDPDGRANFGPTSDAVVSEHELVDEFGEFTGGVGYFIIKCITTLFLVLTLIFLILQLRFDGTDTCRTDPYSLECTKFTRTELEGLCGLSSPVNKTCRPTPESVCGGRTEETCTDPANPCRVGVRLDDGTCEWFSAPATTRCNSTCLGVEGYCIEGECKGRCADQFCPSHCWCRDLGTGTMVMKYDEDPGTGEALIGEINPALCTISPSFSTISGKYSIQHICGTPWASPSPTINPRQCVHTAMESPCFMYPPRDSPDIFDLYETAGPGNQQAFAWPMSQPMAEDGCMSLINPPWRDCIELVFANHIGGRVRSCTFRHKCAFGGTPSGRNKTLIPLQFDYGEGGFPVPSKFGSFQRNNDPEGECAFFMLTGPYQQCQWLEEEERCGYYGGAGLRDFEPSRPRHQRPAEMAWDSKHARLHRHAVSKGLNGLPPRAAPLRDGIAPPDVPATPDTMGSGAAPAGSPYNRHSGSSVGMGLDQMTMEGAWKEELPSADEIWDMLHPEGQ